MILDYIPLFAMLRGKLGYLAQRQRLIAQNVANADTPGFTPDRPEGRSRPRRDDGSAMR